MEQQVSIGSWAILGLVTFAGLIVGSLVAMFSGRALAVLMGVAGMLLFAVGGLLLAGVWYVTRSHVTATATVFEASGHSNPEQLALPMPPKPSPPKTIVAPPVQLLTAEAPDLSADSSLIAANKPATSPPRPAWMDAETGRVGDVYRTRLTVGPWLSRSECERELPEALREAVRTYADQLLGEGKGRFVDLPMSYIHNQIVHGEWEERRQQTIDTMTYLHELLEFDRDARQRIEAEYKESVVLGRLGYTAAGGGALLGLLTIAFGYLKLDTLTRGHYTGRLRLTATAAILALAAVAGLLVMG
jgi:hypothetical protein